MGRGQGTSSAILYGDGAGGRPRRLSANERRRHWAEAHLSEYLQMLGRACEEELTDLAREIALEKAAQYAFDDYRVEMDGLFFERSKQRLGSYYEIYEIPNDSGESFSDGDYVYLDAQQLLDARWLGKAAAAIDQRLSDH